MLEDSQYKLPRGKFCQIWYNQGDYQDKPHTQKLGLPSIVVESIMAGNEHMTS